MPLCFFVLSKSILNILKNIPYKEITNTNKIPRKNFVLYIANVSSALDTLIDINCIKGKTIATNIAKYSRVKTPTIDVITKNQKVNPAATANALNLGGDNSILDRINEGY